MDFLNGVDTWMIELVRAYTSYGNDSVIRGGLIVFLIAMVFIILHVLAKLVSIPIEAVRSTPRLVKSLKFETMGDGDIKSPRSALLESEIFDLTDEHSMDTITLRDFAVLRVPHELIGKFFGPNVFDNFKVNMEEGSSVHFHDFDRSLLFNLINISSKSSDRISTLSVEIETRNAFDLNDTMRTEIVIDGSSYDIECNEKVSDSLMELKVSRSDLIVRHNSIENILELMFTRESVNKYN